MAETASVETLRLKDIKNILSSNDGNRRASDHCISTYERDMLEKKWDVHASIVIDRNGNLLDGQQRLLAALKAETSLRTVVVRNVEPDAQLTIDSGKKRTFTDQLTMHGVKNAGTISSCIMFMFQLASENMKANGLSNNEMQGVLDNHPDIHQSVLFCKDAFRPVNSWLPALHYITTHLDFAEEADQFVEIYRNGQVTYEHDAVVFAREWYIKDAMRDKKTDIDFRRRFFIKSWSYFVKKQPLKRMATVGRTFRIDGWDLQELLPSLVR